jgi:hypothetical protein
MLSFRSIKKRNRRQFQLLVPCGYGAALTARGKIGVRPDTQILGRLLQGCVRSNLPRFIKNLTFEFAKLPGGQGEIIHNFYHWGEFFIVTDQIKNFFCASVPASDLQFSEITICHSDGSLSADKYFAVKIVKTIDCIDPNATLVNGTVPLSKSVVTYELDEQLHAEYSNTGDGRYVSYPEISYFNKIGRISIVDERIPEDVRIFRPKFWPNYLIVDGGFACELRKHCSNPGYDFWTLDFDDPIESHEKLMRELR